MQINTALSVIIKGKEFFLLSFIHLFKFMDGMYRFKVDNW